MDYRIIYKDKNRMYIFKKKKEKGVYSPFSENYFTAMTSTSASAPLGSAATAYATLAGYGSE